MKGAKILAIYNFLRWLAKYCPECKLVLISFRYRWWPIKLWTPLSLSIEYLYEGQRIGNNLIVTVSQILTYLSPYLEISKNSKWSGLDKSTFFFAWTKFQYLMLKKTRKIGNIHFLPSFFKATDLADIYEYVLDLEVTCWSWTRSLWSGT